MAQDDQIELCGLVLSGGKSERMGRDKGALVYHAEPQVKHCFYLLENFCRRVFVALRKEQTGFPLYQDMPCVLDEPQEGKASPARGIISAFRKHPGTAWLVLACDLPFVQQSILRDLVVGRNPQKMATAFYNPETDSPEPMCAIYEPSILSLMKGMVNEGCSCPRKILRAADTEVLTLQQPGILRNINTPLEYESARRGLGLAGPGR